MRPTHLLSAAAALLLAACASTRRTGAAGDDRRPYDVVITGARLVDGTGNPWRYADVAVRGDRIVRVAPGGALAGARSARHVEGRGLVLAPGFIDVQAHGYDAVLAGGGGRRRVSKVTQGVTTEIYGEGSTPAPANAAVLAASGIGSSDTGAVARAHRGFGGGRGFGAWLAAMERAGSSTNSGSFLGAETVRVYAKGEAEGPATPAELDTMRRVVRDAMRDGAFGVASALIYPPGSYASTAELTEVVRAAAPGHGRYITHMRSEEARLLPALDEALGIGRDAGVPVIVYHLKAAGPANWPKAAAAVAKIDSARAAGQDVQATMYPYPASGNALAACLPQWAAEGGRLLERLRAAGSDAALHERIVRSMTDTSADAEPLCQDVRPSDIMVVGFRRDDLKPYEGKRLDEIAAALGKPWTEAVIDLTLREENRLSKITFSMSEPNVAMQLRRPWVMVGSDAGASDPETARGLTHPRAYGTYPRLLGKYVREEQLLTLEDAVRRMTSAVAEALAIPDRGLVREGMMADLVLFDPATVADRATYDRPHQLSTGVRHVFVNGVAVISDGVHTGATPGRAVRGPGWDGGGSP